MTKKFEGIYAAVLTPFRAGGGLDLEAFGNLVAHLYAASVDGIYAGGNTGEWYLQTLEERKEFARAAVELSRGRGNVMVHVGCPRTEDALELARFAESVGADAISSLPPYITRCSIEETVDYYRRLSSATSLPCFIYYFPALTGSGAFLDRVCSLPGVRGIKFADMNLYELGLIADRNGGEFVVFNGHDQVLLPGLVMGASGGVGSFYNVRPEWFVSLYRAWRAGDIMGARARQFQINRLIQAAKKYRLIPALRFMLHLQGIELGPCREPVMPLSADECLCLAREFEQLTTG